MPDLRFHPCQTFGGGWLTAETEQGEDACGEVFGEDAYDCPPIGRNAWIVEPCELGDVIQDLRERGLEVTL